MLTYNSLQEAFYIERSCQRGMIPQSLISYINRKGVAVMNYVEMLTTLKEGKKAFRTNWKEGEFLWQKNGILVHTAPHDVNRDVCPYVTKVEDVKAKDWMILEESMYLSKENV